MLGSQQQQNNRGLYEQTYYSRLRFKNDADKLQIGFSYWKGTLKMSVTEIPKNYDNSGAAKVDELAYIHLSPTKALMMSHIVQEYIDDPGKSDAHGINTGASDVQGLLAMGRENGVPYLIIAKVDANGAFLQQQRFNFNNDYNYDLSFSDVNKLIFSKNYDNMIELQLFKQILVDYASSSNGAVGYSTWDIARYEQAKQNNTIWKIAEKVGVEKGGNSGTRSTGSANGSYFNQQKQNTGSGEFNGMSKPGDYSTGDIDDLEGEFS